ncbi:hypothetical protein RJT34_15881 [Clitoria ternatea]|uniref:Dof zinc finger protein n=1 Tax=Clitoria ternatea TaxID=43366 RepID=A0AAN9J7E9_CLITE
MVYTSIPAYIDPANWQQQQPNHQQGNNTGPSSHLILPPPPPALPSQAHGPGGNTAGSIRPGSMADKARMNIPMQEAPQKCPRCDSTNTKFCYFNNYSLSQPRHFCKTCRRYWTHGGALRNVPVGGGCRRNKRSKGGSGGSSKSPANSDRQTASAGSASTTSGSSSADMIMGLGPSVPPSLRFMAPLHQLGEHHHHFGGEMGLNYGLNYGAISGPMGGVGDLNFNIGSTLSGGGSVLSGLEQWRVPQTHQFPFLSGLEASSSHGLYPIEGGNNSGDGYGGTNPIKVSTCGVMSQLASVKMEDNHQLGLPRQFLGSINNSNSNNNNNPNSCEQYWSGGGGVSSAWTDLSAFNSSSTTSNPL